MMKRRFILFCVGIVFPLTMMSQEKNIEKIFQRVLDVNDLLPASVQVQGSTQGLAIHGGYAFSMHDKGQCVILDLKKERFVNTFVLPGNTGHCNNASFGVQKSSPDSPFPYLYVTECYGAQCCYVNDISLDGSRLVQQICYTGKDVQGPSDWFVDARRARIYLYCTVEGVRTLKWFPLPAVHASAAVEQVYLAQEDALGSIPAGDIAIPQGSHIWKDLIFLPDGVPAKTTRLHLTDARDGKNIAVYGLDPLGLEPEGVAVYGKWLYISFHTPKAPRNNVFYRVRLKDLAGDACL